VFKTLVARGDRTGVLLAVVPGNAQLDLKALARLAGDRKTDTVPSRKCNRSPVRPRRGHRPGLQEGPSRVRGRDHRAVRSRLRLRGRARTQILLAPADYLRATRARTGAIARPA